MPLPAQRVGGRAVAPKLNEQQFGVAKQPTCGHCSSTQVHMVGSPTRPMRICRDCGMASSS